MAIPDSEHLKPLMPSMASETNIICIRYHIANFNEILIGDILCTITTPYLLMQVQWAGDLGKTLYVKYINKRVDGKTGEYLTRAVINNGSFGKLIFD